MDQLQSWISFRLATVRALTGQEFADLITHPMTAEYELILQGIVRAGEVEPLSTLVWECVDHLTSSMYGASSSVDHVRPYHAMVAAILLEHSAHIDGFPVECADLCGLLLCAMGVQAREGRRGSAKRSASDLPPIATWRMCDPPKLSDMPAALEGLISFRGERTDEDMAVLDIARRVVVELASGISPARLDRVEGIVAEASAAGLLPGCGDDRQSVFWGWLRHFWA
ncbi:MAG: hypothetical protein AB7V21_05915 [Phycisphaerales bacterium]